MSEKQIRELMLFRLKQAKETLDEAEVLLRQGYYRGSINRSYYAMFYGVLALAVTRQESFTKHSGAIAFFDRDYIKTGIFEKDYSRK